MAYCYRCGKIFHEESLESDDDSKITICTIAFCKRCMEECDMIIKENDDNELNDEQTVKKAIKDVLHVGMDFVTCKSCGETWFVPGNLKDIMNHDFICIRCQIKKQREG